MNVGGIYVEIKGDSKKLKQELTVARKAVSSSAKDMSDAMGNALSSTKITRSTNKLVNDLSQLERSSKTVGVSFDSLAIDAQKLGVKLGVADREFADLQSRMLKTQAAKAQESALKSIAKAADLTESEIQQLGRQMGVSESAIKSATGSSKNLSTSMFSMGGIAKTAMAYFGVSELMQFGTAALHAMDSVTKLENQLKLVTKSDAELNAVMNQTYDIAAKTRVSWEGTADLYARLYRSTENLNISQDRLASVTESVNQAIAISGTTAASAQAALFQLGQGLGAGALRGEELNSVMEQTPRLAKAIADGLGVTIGQLRTMGSEGKLTAEKVIEAIEKEQKTLRDEFGQTVPTMESGWARVSDAGTKFFGVLDDNMDLTENMAAGLFHLSDGLDAVTEALDDPSPKTKAWTDFFKWYALFGVGTGGGLAVGTLKAMQDLMAGLNSETEHHYQIRQKIDRTALHPDIETIEKFNAEYAELNRDLYAEKMAELKKWKQDQLAAHIDSAKVEELYSRKAAEIYEKYKKKEVDATARAEAKKLREQKSALKKQQDALDDALSDYFNSVDDTEEKIRKEYQETKKAKEKLLKDFDDKFRDLTGDRFEWEKKQIEAQAKAYKEAGADKNDVDRWLKSETAKINEEMERDFAASARQKILDHGTFINGVKLGLKDMQAAQTTWAELGVETVREMASHSERAMSDGLFNVLTGRFDDLEDVWNDLWQGMLHTVTDSVAKMAQEKVVDVALDYAIDWLFAKEGLWKVEKGSQPVVAHKDEMVVPAKLADQLRGEGSNFDEISASLATKQANINAGMTNTGNVASISDIAGLPEGLKTSAITAGKTFRAGAMMTGSFDLDTGMAAMMNPTSVMNIASQGIAAGVAARHGFTQDGMIGPQSIGAGIGSGVAGLLMGTAVAGPIGAIGLALGGLAGRVAGEGVADAFDIRDDEGWLDAMEDKYGWFAAHEMQGQAKRDAARATKDFGWSRGNDSYSNSSTSGSSRDGTDTQDNSPGGGDYGGIGGRWTGGPVYAGTQYEINERGQELFMPGVDGRILNAQETAEMVSALTQVANMGVDQSPEVTLLTRMSGYLYGWRSRWIGWSGDMDRLIESGVEGVDEALSEILSSTTTINGSVLSSTDRLSGDITSAASTISGSLSSSISAMRSSMAAESRLAPSSGGSTVGSTGSSSALRDAAEVFYKSATGGVATSAFNAAMESIGASSHSEFSRMVGYTGDPSDLADQYEFRASGGPVGAGHRYWINERGQEMIMPGHDGRVLNAQETSDMIASLKSIAAGGSDSTSRALFTIAKYCQRSAKILEKWDVNGQPAMES